VLNGGIVGALLDCHSNWAATVALMKAQNLPSPPCTVTSDFAVTLKRPTPMGPDLVLWAKAVDIQGDRATVEATITAEGKVTATCRGTFVAVKPGHPAYHRW
jgi:acyl-coenzyme A thioesterase PaaI-like protein